MVIAFNFYLLWFDLLAYGTPAVSVFESIYSLLRPIWEETNNGNEQNENEIYAILNYKWNNSSIMFKSSR